MFKLLLHITSICGIAFLFSCAGDSMQESKVAAIATEETEPAGGGNNNTSIEISIETLPENLSKEQQKAFELRAKQKFQDFLDYVQLISNPKMNKDLITHSNKLIKELFLNDSITLADTVNAFYIPFNLNNTPSILISDFYNTNPLITFNRPLKIKTKSISFTNPLTSDSTGNYKGVMQAEIVVNKKSTLKHIDVYLIETNKQFGAEEQKTIEIKLGNIY